MPKPWERRGPYPDSKAISKSASQKQARSKGFWDAAGFPDVTNILMLEEQPNSGGTTWAFTAFGDPLYDNTTVLTNPFPHPEIPNTALLIGLATGFSTDANPGKNMSC